MVPLYDPEIVEFEMPLAVPLIVALQFGNPEMPPAAGTSIVNVNELPDTVPLSVPLNVTAPLAVVAVTVPVTDVPDCDAAHVMDPDPLESDVLPV